LTHYPTVFCRWLKQFFENGAAAFAPAPRADKQVEAREQRIAFLEGKRKKKDEVLAELREEHVALKKVLGRPEEPMGSPRHPRPRGTDTVSPQPLRAEKPQSLKSGSAPARPIVV